MAGESAIGALAVRIGADATELLESFSKSGKAAKDLGGVIEGLEKKLFKLAAAFSPIAVAAWIKSMADAADQVGKTAQKVGLAVEALSELQYAAKLADLSNEQLSTGLVKLSKSMLEAKSDTGDMAEVFRAMGVAVTNGAGGPLRDTQQVLFEVADRFAKFKDGADKTALAVKIFGKSGAELIPLLNQGAAGLRENAEEARKFGVVISSQAAKDAEEFNDNLRRLKASSEGLAVAISGPLIKALGDATKAMVESKKEGENLFTTWGRGLSQLLSGGDQGMLEKQIYGATERLVQAMDELDVARRRLSTRPNDRGAAEEFAAMKREVDEARKALIGLQNMRRQFYEEEQNKKKDPKKGEGTENAPYIRPADNPLATAKQQDEGDAELIKQKQEAWEAYYAHLRKVGTDTTNELTGQVINGVAVTKEVTRESAEYYKQVEDERLRALMDAEDRRQEMEIAAGQARVDAEGEAQSFRLENLRQSMLSAQEIEAEAYAKRLEQLQQFSDAELEVHGGRQAVEQQLAAEHYDNLQRIRSRGLNNLADFNKASWADQTKHMIGSLADMTAAAANHNRGMFEINKVASMANAIVKGWEAVQSSYAFGASWGGPVAGAAFAGIAAAATAINVMAIKNASFGGGVAPSFASTAAPPVQPVTTQAQQGPMQTFIIKLAGLSSGSQDSLMELNDRLRNGGRVIFA